MLGEEIDGIEEVEDLEERCIESVDREEDRMITGRVDDVVLAEVTGTADVRWRVVVERPLTESA